MDQTEKTRIWKALETDAQSLRLHLSQHITQKPNIPIQLEGTGFIV